MRKEQICDWVRRGDGYAGMGKENPLASGTAVAVSAFVRAAVRGNFLCGQQRGCPAAQKAGADIIVLCSSDDEYAEFAPAAFKAINGKQIFIVAGAPACMEDLKAQGIENFINVRSNVLETLKSFNAQLLK